MRKIELTRTAAFFPPGLDVLSIAVEMNDAVVPVPVGDEDVALRSDGHIGGPGETPLVLAGILWRSQAQDKLTLRRVLPHRVKSYVCEPDVALRIELDMV